MSCKEKGEQLFIADDVGIVVDLNGLGVVRQVVIGGVLGTPSGVAYTRPDNAVETPELGVGTPESAQGKGRRLKHGRSTGVEWRNARCCRGVLGRLDPDRRRRLRSRGASCHRKRQAGAETQSGQHNGRRLQMMSRMHISITPRSS